MKMLFACPECRGQKEVECCECGSTVECDECNGSGLDNEIIDVKAFEAACHEAFNVPLLKWKKGSKKKRPPTATWALVENGTIIGRTNGEAKVPFAAFRRDRLQNRFRDPLARLDETSEQPQVADVLAWLDA